MKLEKALKNLDKDTVVELEAMDAEALKQRVLQANQAMDQVERELEANPEYQDLKESLKAITLGKKEVFKRQNSIIAVCLATIEGQGGVPA